jgi:HSP20 family protein
MKALLLICSTEYTKNNKAQIMRWEITLSPSRYFLPIFASPAHWREYLMGIKKLGNIMSAKKDQQDKKDEKAVEVDFGMGKISFSGLFQGIGNIIDLVSKLEEEGKDAGEGGERSGEFTSPSGKVKAVYGLSVKRGLGGKPTVESFGNVRKTASGAVVEEEREPLVDIFDEKDHVLIIIELPGIEEEHIKTSVKGDILTLSAAHGDRKYYKEVVLPGGVDTDAIKKKYKNGVLEIRIGKK